MQAHELRDTNEDPQYEIMSTFIVSDIQYSFD
jgi:hypothetical protein